jgi:hypothetical protein
MIHGRYSIYNETVHGPNQERGIAANDWRDADAVLDLTGCRVIELEGQGANRRVVVQNDRGEHIDVSAWLEGQVGRVLVLPIVARDEQRHNQASGE